MKSLAVYRSHMRIGGQSIKPGARKRQTGFTIIELLIATVVFSVLLILMMTAIIRISDLFYKGVSMSKTQEDARNIVQSIASDIQFTDGAPIANNGVFCIGIHRYQYQLGTQVDGTSAHYGLQRDDQGRGGCTSGGVCGPNCVKMLDNNMQLNDITDYSLPTACQNGICTVHIHLVFYGGSSTGLFKGSRTPYDTATDAQCIGSLSDTSLCAVVDYDSTVLEGTKG